MLSVRVEFGYWVFEGDLQPIQRPSWNYRAEDGGGIILDMLCHWRYVLDNLFGEVQVGVLPGRHAHPAALGRSRPALRGDRRRRRVRDLRAHGPQRRAGDRADQQLVGDARAARRPGDLPRRRHARLGGGRAARLPRAGARQHAAAGLEPRRPAGDELLSSTGSRCPTSQVYDNGFKIQWEPSSATWPRTRRTAGRCPKAPRACSWSRPRCRAGTSGAGSTCRRWRSEGLHDASTASRLPTADGTLAALHAARRRGDFTPAAPVPALTRIAFSAAHVVADARADIDPWLQLRGRLGRDHRLPPAPVAPGPGRGRGDGHRAARHGAGLADLARADPPLASTPRATCPARCSPRAAGTDHLAPEDAKSRRRRDPRLRGADGGDREARRQAHRDGQPRAGARRALGPADYERVYDRVLQPGARAGDPALARRHVRPGAAPATGAAPTSPPRWTRRWASSPRTRARSTASRSRCSTRTRRSRCAGGCPPACACTPATTSTTPS